MGSTFENRANLAPMFLASIVKRYQGTRLGRQELEAELIEDVEGALWNRDRLDECRRPKAPEFKRIVVAIDPAISVGEDSDETGIIVAGLGVDEHGYILEDASGKYLPTEWASKAVNLYRKWEADRIVAEINQGGAMVESTIRTVDKNVAYRGVTSAGRCCELNRSRRFMSNIGCITLARFSSSRTKCAPIAAAAIVLIG